MKKKGKTFFKIFTIELVLIIILTSSLIKAQSHDSNEVYIKSNNQDKTLQKAIDDGDFLVCGTSSGNYLGNFIGHTGENVIVNIGGKITNLQQAINSGEIKNVTKGTSPANFGQITFGHDSKEVLIKINGVEKTLQDAINNGDFECNPLCKNEYSEGYSIYSLEKRFSSYGYGKWTILINNSQVISGADQKGITYFSKDGNWTPTTTWAKEGLYNITGQYSQGGEDPHSQFRVKYRIYGNTSVQIKTETWGNNKVKINRTDIFYRKAKDVLEINGVSYKLDAGKSSQLEYAKWNPGDHGSGDSYLNVSNGKCQEYFEIEQSIREYDEENDSSFIKLFSSILKA